MVSGSISCHDRSSGIQITARNLTVNASGSINANAKGCQGNTGSQGGYGPHTSTGVCTISTSGYGIHTWGGGAHGGYGGQGSVSTRQTVVYGSSTQPSLLGSGGAGWDAAGDAIPGTGGGRITLTLTGTLTGNGTISANGGAGLSGGGGNGSGGGSGGSVHILTGTLAGSGSITATGGNGGSAYGGGGGGGRAAVYYDTLSGFTGLPSRQLVGPGVADLLRMEKMEPRMFLIVGR